MEYPTYLVHFNKNHSKDNGQFISGDGDGDGIIDDHAHRGKKELTFKEKWQIGSGVASVGFGAWTLYKGYKKGNKFVMALGGVKIALGAYKIAKGSGFVDKVKDSFITFDDDVKESVSDIPEHLRSTDRVHADRFDKQALALFKQEEGRLPDFSNKEDAKNYEFALNFVEDDYYNTWGRVHNKRKEKEE